MSSNDEPMSGRDRDDERLEALLAEHDDVLAQESVRVSARQRLIEIQDECFAILGSWDYPAGPSGQRLLSRVSTASGVQPR